MAHPNRPGLNIDNHNVNRRSRKIDELDANLEETLILDKQLKQLKLIKTHLEVQTGEVLELSQNDDDDAGGSL